MIAFIRGILVQALPASAVLETSGIGYKILIPVNVFSKLPQMGNEVLLHTSFIVRELSQTLYGFLSMQERDLFDILLGVTGIGPKLALSLIGHLSFPDMQEAISTGNITAICKVPGIGKKSAERLMIELRDKLAAVFPREPSEFAIDVPSLAHSKRISDAMSALINLGYNQMTAQKALKKTLQELPEEADLGVLITNALNNVH